MRLWAALYIVLSIADFVLTYIGLSAGYSEVNPFAAAAWASFGVLGLLAFKAAIVAVFLRLVIPLWHRRGARWLGLAGLAILGYTVYHNFVTVWG